jgi:hypothetical protein
MRHASVHNLARPGRYSGLMVAIICSMVAGWGISPGPSARAAQLQARQRVPRPTIAQAPEYSSSVDSITIEEVRLADAQIGPLVRIRLRNRTDETVIGVEFEIRGSDPTSILSHCELTQLQNPVFLPIIEPSGERAFDLPAADFKTGDTLRLAAVLFLSGRGEGDVFLVDEMRRDASSSQPPVPRGKAPT